MRCSPEPDFCSGNVRIYSQPASLKIFTASALFLPRASRLTESALKVPHDFRSSFLLFSGLTGNSKLASPKTC